MQRVITIISALRRIDKFNLILYPKNNFTLSGYFFNGMGMTNVITTETEKKFLSLVYAD